MSDGALGDGLTLLVPSQYAIGLPTIDGVRVLPYSQQERIAEEHRGATGLVVWQAARPWLDQAARDLPRLRWVQTLSAGPDAVLATGFRSDVVVTSGRSLHDWPVTEHALALVLAAARRLDLLVRAQIGHRWAKDLGGSQPLYDPDRFTTLRGAKVVIWGFGSIAATLAPVLTSLGATVVGVARTAGRRGDFEVLSTDDLPETLPGTDVLIMLLPGTPENARALSGHLIGLLPRHAWVINLGRGATVDETALTSALIDRRLGGAALDVFPTEPLPMDSPLWDVPNLIVSPHAAGGRPDGAEKLIADNARRFVAGDELRNVVR